MARVDRWETQLGSDGDFVGTTRVLPQVSVGAMF